MKAFTKLLSVVTLGVLLSCNSEPSLQKYFVENSDNPKFVNVDIAKSSLNFSEEKLTSEELAAIETVKKLNVIAYQVDPNKANEYIAEQAKVKSILSDAKYQELMKMGEGESGITVRYVGTDELIDEVVVFASDEKKGFVVARIIGQDMTPTSLMTLVQAMQHSKIDMSKLKQFESFMNTK